MKRLLIKRINFSKFMVVCLLTFEYVNVCNLYCLIFISYFSTLKTQNGLHTLIKMYALLYFNLNKWFKKKKTTYMKYELNIYQKTKEDFLELEKDNFLKL